MSIPLIQTLFVKGMPGDMQAKGSRWLAFGVRHAKAEAEKQRLALMAEAEAEAEAEKAEAEAADVDKSKEGEEEGEDGEAKEGEEGEEEEGAEGDDGASEATTQQGDALQNKFRSRKTVQNTLQIAQHGAEYVTVFFYQILGRRRQLVRSVNDCDKKSERKD